MGTGVYCHVPFCKRRCAYCDFYVEIRPLEIRRRTVRAILAEAESAAGEIPGGVCESLYIGGGTPSHLGGDLATALASGLRARLPFDPAAEITMEANPESLDRPLLDAIRAAGVNRLSIGVQSLDDASLAALGRAHDARGAREAVRLAREAGFENLSCDLIYGLPAAPGAEQREDSRWRRSLEETIGLGPDHISCYLLTLEDHVPLARHLASGSGGLLPGEEQARAAYETAVRALEDAGYGHYEISNWSRRGFECRHNLGVWRGGYYLGLGPGAHGHLPGRRTANRRDLEGYIASLERGDPPRREEIPTDERSASEESVMLGLRLRDGVAWADLGQRFDPVRLARIRERIAPLAPAGLIEDDGVRLRLGREGLFVSNAIVAEILAAAE